MLDVADSRYTLNRRIGSGAFGEIWQGRDLLTDEDVAIKLESSRAKHPQLHYESKLYRIFRNSVGMPTSRWYGTESGYNVLVMDLMGPSLEDMFDICGRKFSLKTVLMLADQMISRLESLHTHDFLHRDIKPENFLLGTGINKDQVHIIDFGLAKKYRDKHHATHIPYKEGKSMIGTSRYASLSAHLGYEQGRRDDLEALGYVLLYFLNGSLPWQGLHAPTDRIKNQLTSNKKMTMKAKELCEGLPEEFTTYFEYCRSLGFEDKPDYVYLKQIFRDLAERQGYQNDSEFDWMNEQAMSCGLDEKFVTPDTSFASLEQSINQGSICEGATSWQVSLESSNVCSSVHIFSKIGQDSSVRKAEQDSAFTKVTKAPSSTCPTPLDKCESESSV